MTAVSGMSVISPPRSLKEFQDILREKHEKSDFLFMSRTWNPMCAYKHIHKTNPTKIKRDVFCSVPVQRAIEEVSRDMQVNKEQLYKTVHNILDEIGYNKRMSVIRWLGLMLTKILKRNYTSLNVNENSINRVKSVMGSNPVIFAPSHRSYADFILMSYICYNYDIEIPVIAAGMDFYSMWILGQMLRDTGAFFMRRSFGKDKLYWAIFSEYVHKLVTDGDTAIEFFIEGTRSRTAKSLMPKFGFLSMALQPFFEGLVPDITVVPINISYDRTLEEVLFAYELLGVPKPKESTTGFLKALKMLDEQYGKIYLEFAEPISVKSLYAPQEDPRIYRSTQVEALLCSHLAHRIVRAQQHSCVLTPFNVLALIINNSILKGEDLPTLQTAVREFSWLCSVLETLGALIDHGESKNYEEVLRESLRVHKYLVQLSPENNLVLSNIHKAGLAVSTPQMKGHRLSHQTMEIATPVVMLQHYVNPCLHYIICPALVTTALQTFDTKEISRDILYKKFHFLWLLLSHEFVLNGAWEQEVFEESIRQLYLLNIVEILPSGNLTIGNHRKLQIIFRNILQPFLTGYLVLCNVFWQAGSTSCQDGAIFRETQKQVEKLLLSGENVHPHALSLDMYSCALQSLVSLRCVLKFRRDGNVEYCISENELRGVMGELEKFVSTTTTKSDALPSQSEMFVFRERAKL